MGSVSTSWESASRSPGRAANRFRFAATDRLPALGATDAEHALLSEDAGIDWNAVFLLGMMLIVGVLKRTGLFEYVAIWAAKKARGTGSLLGLHQVRPV